MKKSYKKETWLLDGDILLHGYKDKRGFHPENGLQCGFNLQKVNRKSYGKTLFHSLDEAVTREKAGKIAGGKIVAAIDKGMSVTRIVFNMGNKKHPRTYMTYTLIEGSDIVPVLKECLASMGIMEVYNTKIIYSILSEHSMEISAILTSSADDPTEAPKLRVIPETESLTWQQE